MRHLNFKYIQNASIIFIAFCFGVYVKASLTPSIGVVNIEQVLENSPKFIAIKTDNDKKMAELAKWVEEVNNEIAEEKDSAKRNKLAKQYRKLIYEKETFVKQEYSSKLQDINIEMTALINKVAKKNGCNYIFANTSMVTGGKDITQNVIKKLKKNP